MQLRAHPLMSHHGVRNWPPVWTRTEDGQAKKIRGEIGTLMDVFTYDALPGKLFLRMGYEGCQYTACLTFDDLSFCRQLCSVLENYRGSPIDHIGNLDFGFTL